MTTESLLGDADRINDLDAKIDSDLLKIAEEYVECENQAKALNERKKSLREKAERLEQHPTAFRTAIMWVKLFSNADRISVLSSFHRMIGILGDRQKDLFPEQVKKLEERAAKKMAKDGGRTQSELDAATDTSERSDPNVGGAKPAVENPPDEQAAGDAALNAGLPETKAAGKKKSQSQIAKEIASAAGTLN